MASNDILPGAGRESSQGWGPGPSTATGARLAHPLVLGAVALLALNDHVLKRLSPGVVTGKLSDFAGLVFFPLLLAELWLVARRRFGMGGAREVGVREEQVVWLCTLATGVAFAWVNSSALGAEVYRVGLGGLQWLVMAPLDWLAGHGVRPPHRVAFTRDPSDLVALLALWVPLWLERRRRARLGRLAVLREPRRRETAAGVGL